jgi:AraC family transcriptional regulator
MGEAMDGYAYKLGNFLPPRVSTRTWLGIPIQSFEQKVGPGSAWHKFQSSAPIVSVILKEVGGDCETRTNLDRQAAKKDRSAGGEGHISIVPMGSDVWGYTNGVSLVHEARFFIDTASANEIVGEEFSEDALRSPSLMKVDHEIQTIARLLFAESWRKSVEPLYVEGLISAFLARLGRVTKHHKQKARQSGLTPKQLRSVKEFIADNVSENISLMDLAELVGLSRSQFGRAFKTSTGVSPHRYHLEQRLTLAKELLTTSRQSLVEIALAAGFSEQSHFNRVFRSSTGATPTVWRRGQ